MHQHSTTTSTINTTQPPTPHNHHHHTTIYHTTTTTRFVARKEGELDRRAEELTRDGARLKARIKLVIGGLQVRAWLIYQCWSTC